MTNYDLQLLDSFHLGDVKELFQTTERTKETGIRMSIGARRNDILQQFLIEAILLSIVGGYIGVVLGITSSNLISRFAWWPILVSPAAANRLLHLRARWRFFGSTPRRKPQR